MKYLKTLIAIMLFSFVSYAQTNGCTDINAINYNENANFDDGVWIYQNAWFNMGEFTKDKQVNYNLKHKQNGVYVFIIEGKATIYENNLERWDGFGVWNISSLAITVKKGAKVLLMDVPMLT